MSAPNPGRQSPSPSRQSGAQQQDAPSSGKTSTDPSSKLDERSKEQSEATKAGGLESNPEGPMEGKADVATGKDGRGVE
ncbi:MAG: hypothetical protein M1832_004354 [Thelocarpon impressellum]|nr:MAG: hypothetical protein M1832_004354 [Thelocarpon impressellum]